MSAELETSDIRRGYAWTPRERPAEYTSSRMAEFDRWLEAHDREVAAKAWDEGWDRHVFFDQEDYGKGSLNPYKNGGTL